MVFIDGSWLYRSRLLLQQEYPSPDYKLDYGKIPTVVQNRLSTELGVPENEVDIVRTHLFGSIPVNVADEDREKIDRQDSFYKLLREKYHYQTEVFSIDFGGRPLSGRSESGDSWVPREKCVDIALTSSMLYQAAINGIYDIGVLVAGDLDYKPLLRKLRLLGKRIMIVGVRGSTCREFLVQDSRDQIRDFDVLFLNDYLDELELKMETRKYSCGRCSKVFYTDYQPRNGQKVFCDDCRGVPTSTDTSYGMRLSGRVKVWKPEEGYGFIERPNGSDVFVHVSQLQENGIEDLTPGQPIQFEIEETTRGPQARNIDIQPVANEYQQFGNV